jgi:hypothetical protein
MHVPLSHRTRLDPACRAPEAGRLAQLLDDFCEIVRSR